MNVRRVSSWTSVFVGMIALVVIFSGSLLGQETPTYKLNFADAPGFPMQVDSGCSGTIGDFNEDGHLDIATLASCHYGRYCEYVEGGTAAVSVFLGHGDGTFTGPTYFPVGDGSWNSYEIVSGDFNNDGHLDLAVTNPGTGIHNWGAVGVFVLLGDGKGNFTSNPDNPFPTGFEPSGMAVADLDKDGNLDLAVSCTLSGYISVLFGDGKGGFLPAMNVPLPPAQPDGIVAADFNGDGWLDLAVASQYSVGKSVFMLLAKPGGHGFEKARAYKVVAANDTVVAGDFNEDGYLDLAVPNETDYLPNTTKMGTFLSFLSGNGKGEFTSQPPVPLDGIDPMQSVVTDLNQDGHLDLAIANSVSNDVSILLGDGKGGFHPAGCSPVPVFSNANKNEALMSVDWVGVGDFNEDGRPDLAIVGFDVIAIKLSKGGSR